MPANKQGNSNFFNYSALTQSYSQRTAAAQQEASAAAREPNIKKTSSNNPTASPATAVAAPNANSITVFTGLCDALNQFQKNLVKKKLYSIADEYVIEFAPETIAQSTVALKGTTCLLYTSDAADE